MLRLSLLTLASAAFLATAPAAHALNPGELFAVSGQPGANAFLPGLANDSTLVDAEPGTSFVITPNSRRLSTDGRYVTFASKADGLTAGDDDRWVNVYVQDRDTGLVEVVSVAAPGGVVDGDSRVPAISADGRTVAFESDAALVPPTRTTTATCTCATSTPGRRPWPARAMARPTSRT